MHNSKIPWIKAVTFLIILITVNYIVTFVVVPKGGNSRMTMREMYSQSKNVDVAFIGASYSERDINPYVMDKELGENTLDYSFAGQKYSGTYYSLKELFSYHKPKLVVLTTGVSSYTAKEEQSIAYFSVELYMKSLTNKIQFYFGSTQDGSYLDRLFPWRGYHVNSIQDAVKNLHEKLDISYKNYPEGDQVEAFSTHKNGYIGKGAFENDPNDPQGTIKYDNLKKELYNRVEDNVKDIQKINFEYLQKISELCKANNCELVLLYPPLSTFEVLREKDYFEFENEIAKNAKELGIDYYNFNLIKPQLFKIQGDYFNDNEHFNMKGAEAFSKSLADFLKLRQNGEDMSKYFYTPDEYYGSIDYVALTWYKWTKSDNKIKLTADSLQGSKVVPEYQFVLTDTESGKAQIIRDYDKNPNFEFDCSTYKKFKIKVNTRVSGASNDDLTRHYEEEIAK